MHSTDSKGCTRTSVSMNSTRRGWSARIQTGLNAPTSSSSTRFSRRSTTESHRASGSSLSETTGGHTSSQSRSHPSRRTARSRAYTNIRRPVACETQTKPPSTSGRSRATASTPARTSSSGVGRTFCAGRDVPQAIAFPLALQLRVPNRDHRAATRGELRLLSRRRRDRPGGAVSLALPRRERKSRPRRILGDDYPSL